MAGVYQGLFNSTIPTRVASLSHSLVKSGVACSLGMGVLPGYLVKGEGLGRLQTVEGKMKEAEKGREGPCSVLCLFFGRSRERVGGE